MVVSCRFRYGTLVIGTGSMTGTINKGDIIIYERYEKEELEIGEIIVFKTENVFVIHRIIDNLIYHPNNSSASLLLPSIHNSSTIPSCL